VDLYLGKTEKIEVIAETYELDTLVRMDKVALIHGDLVIEGHLIMEYGALVVTGNLTVEGSIMDDPITRIIVGGNLKAQNIVTQGAIIVRGEVEAAELVYGVEDIESFYVGGDLRCRLLLEEYHEFYCFHECHAMVRIEEEIFEDSYDALSEILIDEVILDSAILVLDIDLIKEILLEGDSVFK